MAEKKQPPRNRTKIKSKIIYREGDWYAIAPNPKIVTQIIGKMDDFISETDANFVDALTSLCIMSIMVAQSCSINKPQFLTRVSCWWEKLEAEDEESLD